MNSKRITILAVASFMGVMILSTTALATSGPQTEHRHRLETKLSNRTSEDAKRSLSTHRKMHIDRMESKLTEKLDNLTASGALTQQEATKIKAKLNELKSSLKEKSWFSRAQNHGNVKSEIQKWLDDNDIELKIDQLLKPRPGQI